MLRLILERGRRGLTQSELARLTGIRQSTLSHLEHGLVYPFPGWKKRIGEVLRADPETLFDDVDPWTER